MRRSAFIPLTATGVLAFSGLLAAGCTSQTATPTTAPPAATATRSPSAPTATASSGGLVSPTTQGFFLQVNTPADESVVKTSSIEVKGKSTPDAVVSVNGQVAQLDAEGIFTVLVHLQPGPNAIDVVASDFHGHQQGTVVNVIYNP